MSIQTVFRRYEIKYMLTAEQKQRVLAAMADHMALDRYGRTTIRNIYFDTDDYRLIRRSVEKPTYKEKLRIRGYGKVPAGGTVFVELKKKYDGVVYKRRLLLAEEQAMEWLLHRRGPDPTQITREVDYFLEFYETLRPTVFLSYEREAYYAKDGSDFRITFDERLLCRRADLSLRSEVYGTPLLPEGMALMEIKCSGGLPLWMTAVLSQERLYKTSFSKYGTAYETMVRPRLYPLKSYACLAGTVTQEG